MNRDALKMFVFFYVPVCLGVNCKTSHISKQFQGQERQGGWVWGIFLACWWLVAVFDEVLLLNIREEMQIILKSCKFVLQASQLGPKDLANCITVAT